MHQNNPGKIFAVVQNAGDKKTHKSWQFLCIRPQTKCVYYFFQTNFSTTVELPHHLV